MKKIDINRYIKKNNNNRYKSKKKHDKIKKIDV